MNTPLSYLREQQQEKPAASQVNSRLLPAAKESELLDALVCEELVRVESEK